MIDRQPKFPNRNKVYNETHQLVGTYYVERDDEPTVPGDPLNKATLLSDAAAALYGLPPTATPSQAFEAARDLISGLDGDIKARVVLESGSYVGTGKADSSKNAQAYTFQNAPGLVFISHFEASSGGGSDNYTWCMVFATGLAESPGWSWRASVGNATSSNGTAISTLNVQKAGKTFRWWAKSAGLAFNTTGETYSIYNLSLEA